MWVGWNADGNQRRVFPTKCFAVCWSVAARGGTMPSIDPGIPDVQGKGTSPILPLAPAWRTMHSSTRTFANAIAIEPLLQLSYAPPCLPVLPPTRIAFQVRSPLQSRMHVAFLLPPATLWRWRWRWRVVLPRSHPLLSPCLSRVWHLDPGEDEVCPRT